MTANTNIGALSLFTGVPLYENFARLHLTQGRQADAVRRPNFPLDARVTL